MYGRKGKCYNSNYSTHDCTTPPNDIECLLFHFAVISKEQIRKRAKPTIDNSINSRCHFPLYSTRVSLSSFTPGNKSLVDCKVHNIHLIKWRSSGMFQSAGMWQRLLLRRILVLYDYIEYRLTENVLSEMLSLMFQIIVFIRFYWSFQKLNLDLYWFYILMYSASWISNYSKIYMVWINAIFIRYWIE